VLSPELVAQASAAWLWYPDDATVVDTDDYLLVRWPSYFASAPEVIRFSPRGDVAATLDEVLGRARAWDVDALICWVKLDAPAGYEELLQRRGATPEETVDVFARDLARGVPDLAPPDDLRVAWRHDLRTSRDCAAVSVAAFEEGAVPDDETLLRLAREAEADRLAGRGGEVIVYDGDTAIGTGGLTMAGTTARLWGAGVLPEARGRGAYRAVLAARLDYAVAHGATLALVKGRVKTSGPILRRAGFEAFGQERSYRLPLM